MADRWTVCPRCGAAEAASQGPETAYACGSRDYEARAGTFRQGQTCRLLEESYWRGYEKGLADQSGSQVLQAVLDAIAGTLDLHSQIADHPNVKFAQHQRLALENEILRATRK